MKEIKSRATCTFAAALCFLCLAQSIHFYQFDSRRINSSDGSLEAPWQPEITSSTLREEVRMSLLVILDSFPERFFISVMSRVRLACDKVLRCGAVAFRMLFRLPLKFCRPSHISLRLMQCAMWQYIMLTIWLHTLNALAAILILSLFSSAHTFARHISE